MISLYNVRKQMDSGKEFSLEWLTAGGDLLKTDAATCLSEHRRSGMRNIKLTKSGEIRKICEYLIMRYDGQEVYL